MKNKKNYHIYISTILYIIVYYYAYTEFLYPIFEYAGFEFYDKSLDQYMLIFLLCFIPSLFYREGKISSFIALFIYIILYIPIIFAFSFTPQEIDTRNYLLQFIFFMGMISFFYVAKIPTKNELTLTSILFRPDIILFFSVLFSVVTLVVYRNNLKFASFEDVYDLREQNSAIASGNAFLAYINVWLTNFYMPYCLAYGIINKKRLFIYCGLAIAMILYVSSGAKIAILFPLVYLFFIFLAKRNIIEKFYPFIVYSLAFFIVLFLILLSVYPENTNIFWVNSVVLARTLGNGGLLTYWYDLFFQNNPYTYYSHINFVNLLTGAYPYDRELGLVIGGAFWDPKLNANANFWATDGIAAAGILGCILANLLMLLVLRILDVVSYKKNKLFVILLFLPFISMFLNTSIFTALLSGGAFLSILSIANLKK